MGASSGSRRARCRAASRFSSSWVSSVLRDFMRDWRVSTWVGELMRVSLEER